MEYCCFLTSNFLAVFVMLAFLTSKTSGRLFSLAFLVFAGFREVFGFFHFFFHGMFPRLLKYVIFAFLEVFVCFWVLCSYFLLTFMLKAVTSTFYPLLLVIVSIAGIEMQCTSEAEVRPSLSRQIRLMEIK